MKNEEFEHWGKAREKGSLRFILVSGIISWGVPMFIVMNFVVNMSFLNGIVASELLLQLGIWLSAGAFFGIGVWFTNEFRYKRTLKS